MEEARSSLTADNKASNQLVARLPLIEGDAVIEMPRFMQQESLDAFKAWLDHLAAYAEASFKLLSGPKIKIDKDDPTSGKRW
jgi:hypothetical protein